jgi:glycosyltransferase involved in cell wall biosynthesis
MKVLYVVHDFFPNYYGGAERYVLNLCHQMQRLGHQAHVLTYGLDEPATGFPERCGPMLSRSYVFEGIEVTALRHQEVPADVQFRVEDGEVADAVASLLEATRTEIVHVAHPMRLASCYLAARRCGVPVLLTLTDFWLPCPRGRFFKLDFSPCSSPEEGRKCVRDCHVPGSVIERYQQARRMFDSVARVTAPSRLTLEAFSRCGWVRPITHISHGVDYRTVQPLPRRTRGKGKIVFGYIGVLKKFKGVDLLLRSFHEVPLDNLELKIFGTLVGDEEFRPEIESLAALDPRIRLLGKYRHADLPEVMSGIDVMVVPSTTLESYGLVVVESLAYGVPVIASDMVGSAHEWIRDGESGFVFPVAHPERLRELIERVARDPAVVDRLRAAMTLPPRIEEEAFMVESVYSDILRGGRS